MQGLPGYRGSENGIGIGLGLQQLAQARAQVHLSAQQSALTNGFVPGSVTGIHNGFQASTSSGSEQDISRISGVPAISVPSAKLQTTAVPMTLLCCNIGAASQSAHVGFQNAGCLPVLPACCLYGPYFAAHQLLATTHFAAGSVFTSLCCRCSKTQILCYDLFLWW